MQKGEINMKKFILLILILICMSGLVACNKTTVTEETIVGKDLIPMVMINKVIYIDTGKESIAEREDSLFDGEITSTVKQSQIPTENNQSNFGTGYGYQYGTEETIEIYINGKWWVFKAEN